MKQQNDEQYCDCGKVMYHTVIEVRTAVANISRNDRKHKYTFYHCKICNSFHVTTVKNPANVRKKDGKYPIKYIHNSKLKSEKKKNKNQWKKWK